jgi:hypothetical protein
MGCRVDKMKTTRRIEVTIETHKTTVVRFRRRKQDHEFDPWLTEADMHLEPAKRLTSGKSADVPLTETRSKGAKQ